MYIGKKGYVMEYFVTGFILGITAGISPGPLMAVLISETLKGNIKNGLVISIIPVITDIPLIVLLVVFFKQLQYSEIIIKVLSFSGFIVLLYYGIKDLFTEKVEIDLNVSKVSSFKKGLITNLLNPHPYIFWGLVGVPFMISGNTVQMVLFVLSFFTGIVGSKILIAVLTERSKRFIQSRYYLYLIKLSGLVLIVFGLILFFRAFNSSL